MKIGGGQKAAIFIFRAVTHSFLEQHKRDVRTFIYHIFHVETNDTLLESTNIRNFESVAALGLAPL